MHTTCLYRIALALTLALPSTQSAHAAYVPPATERVKTQLNGTWKFTKSNSLTGAEVTAYNDSAWSSVTVPHTWNSVDASVNNIADYSNAWYRTHFNVAAADAGKKIYVNFEGVFQFADVYVNGTRLGQHRGGYTRFIFDASSVVNFGGDNVLAVKVSNKDCSDCLPDTNTRLWKGYGGIYRKAWIVKTPKHHIDPTDYASSGVYGTPTVGNGGSSSVSVTTMLRNSDSVSKTFTVKNVVTDANENVVLTLQQDVVVAAHARTSTKQSGAVASPQLWSKSNPYLYNVHTTVSTDGLVRDAVDEKIGFRFYLLSNNDFTLNGVSTKIRGVSKHQESEYNATAVNDAELIQDWDNIADLGANFVRLPHYPHAALEYDLADQRGIMVWAENGHTNSGLQATTNGSNLTREMVYQNWNHPSIFFWSAGNEAPGVDATSQYAQDIRDADRSRPVVYASDGQTPANVDYIWRNLYPGWYGSGSMYDFVNSPSPFVSESGAGMSISTHTDDYFATAKAINSFEPEEQGMLNNEVKAQAIFVTKVSSIPAFANWTFRDFGDVKYKNHINTKGLMTFSNYKKGVYYLFKSFLKPNTPLVHVAGPHFWLRKSAGNIKVYSNASNITLTVNKVSRGKRANGAYSHPNGMVINNTFYWTDALQVGKNIVVASDGNGNTDTAVIYYAGNGVAAPPDATALVTNLSSSNGNNSAFYINTPVQSQWTFYHSFDGKGDNTVDVVPSILSGAGWIATKRQSDNALSTGLSFALSGNADVYVMFSKQASVPSWLSGAGFSDTGVTGKWRDNDLKRVDYQLFKVSCSAGNSVNLGGSAIDFVVLVKPGSGGACTGQSSPIKYEAESAALSGAVVATSSPGYSGTGFVDYLNLSNDYIEWTVNIAAAGTRTLDFRFANGSTGIRSLAISVNGTVVSAGLAFNPTGSWSAWSNATLNAVLPAGNVRIRATATGSSGPNMDSLTIR